MWLRDVFTQGVKTISLDSKKLQSPSPPNQSRLFKTDASNLPWVVEDFRKKYNRTPSLYAAQSYDAAMLINAALTKTGGKADNRDTLRAALKSSEFKSVAGPFRFNTNQFPIRNFYRVDVAKDASGQAIFVNKGVVLKDHADAYYKECAL